MKQIPGTNLWVPDGDAHFCALNKRTKQPVAIGYQADRIAAAVKYTKEQRIALDIGAHVGLLTIELARRFEEVIAFEPNPQSYQCLKRNLANYDFNVTTYNLALGDVNRDDICLDAGMDNNSGDVQISNQSWSVGTGVGPIKMTTLDDLSGHGRQKHVDLVKIDVQGYEYYVLKGGMKLLLENRPVVVIEVEDQKKLRQHYDKADKACWFLEKLGAHQVDQVGADRIYSW